MKVAMLIFILGLAAASSAAELRRGPYLQSASTNAITIRWRTDVFTDSLVRFGTNSLSLPGVVFDAQLTDEHDVRITNLLAGTKYWYSVGATGTNFPAGDEHYFITSPALPKAVRIWAIGDSGTATFGSSAPASVRDAYLSYSAGRHTDVWLMLGDNAYGSGTDDEYQIAVFDVFKNELRNTVLWPTLGNHDTYAPSSGAGLAYFNLATLPRNGDAGGIPSGSEAYYSFDYGNIHFVCLDSEWTISSPGAMLAWLETDLAANTKEWLIAYWHSPPYTKGSHNSDNPGDSAGHLIFMRENVVPVLESYGVDLVLCGHSHSYERSFLLNGHYGYSWSLAPEMIMDEGSGREDDTGGYVKGFANPENAGAVYIVAGSSGQTSGGPLNHPAMFFSLNRLGSVVIDVDGARLDACFLRETGEVEDYFTLTKTDTPRPLEVVTFRRNNAVMLLRWKSKPHTRYQVEMTYTFEDLFWFPVSPVITATGHTSSWSGPADPSDRGFYRIVEISP